MAECGAFWPSFSPRSVHAFAKVRAAACRRSRSGVLAGLAAGRAGGHGDSWHLAFFVPRTPFPLDFALGLRWFARQAAWQWDFHMKGTVGGCWGEVTCLTFFFVYFFNGLETPTLFDSHFNSFIFFQKLVGVDLLAMNLFTWGFALILFLNCFNMFQTFWANSSAEIIYHEPFRTFQML